MPVFYFPQFEHEPFWSYLSRLNDYRAQLNQSFEKWEICEVIVIGLNAFSRGYVESMCLGGFQGLLSKTQDEVWNFFEKLAWDTYQFEQVSETLGYPTHGEYASHPYHQDHFAYSYNHSAYSTMFPILCDYCESSDHNVHNCPFHDYVDARCVSLEKTINKLRDKMIKVMKEKIVEYSHCFNQSMEDNHLRQSDSNLGSLEPAVSLSDDFEHSIQVRLDSHNDVPFSSLEQESNHSLSLSSDRALEPSSHRDVIKDVLIFGDPPTPFTHSCELEEGEGFESDRELDISITTNVAHHNYKDSEDTFVNESCGDVVKFVPVNLELDVAEYECFSFGSDKIESLDVDLYVEYESFSFAPIITHHFYEAFKSDFFESKPFAPITVDLNHSLEYAKIKGPMNLGPTNVPRYFVHDYHSSRPMTHVLANFEYISLSDAWAQQFDKLKRALTCATLLLWMYYLCFQLSHFYCINFTASCACLFDKLLRALLGFDLNSNFQLDMEWLMLHQPLLELIIDGYSLDALLHLTWYNCSSLSSLFLSFLCVYLLFYFLFIFFLFDFTSSFSFCIFICYFYASFHPQ